MNWTLYGGKELKEVLIKKTTMESFGKYIFSYVGGIIFIIIGILKVRYQKKQPAELDDSPLQPYLEGWAFGIGTIVLGVTIIICKLLGKY